MVDTIARTASETARLDSHQVARYLLERLGPTLTAYIANSRSRAMPKRWATDPAEDPAGAATPSQDRERRLRAAHTVFLLIEKNDNDQVARNWLVSPNPRLGGIMPAQAIRDDDHDHVFLAADAFLVDVMNH